MDDQKGLINKYEVRRVDGKNDDNYYRGELYKKADYFVLKLNSGNKYEIDALEAYAESCKDDLPLLSRDLFRKTLNYRKRYKEIFK